MGRDEMQYLIGIKKYKQKLKWKIISRFQMKNVFKLDLIKKFRLPFFMHLT